MDETIKDTKTPSNPFKEHPMVLKEFHVDQEKSKKLKKENKKFSHLLSLPKRLKKKFNIQLSIQRRRRKDEGDDGEEEEGRGLKKKEDKVKVIKKNKA